jgi:hypothetical protein
MMGRVRGEAIPPDNGYVTVDKASEVAPFCADLAFDVGDYVKSIDVSWLKLHLLAARSPYAALVEELKDELWLR